MAQPDYLIHEEALYLAMQDIFALACHNTCERAEEAGGWGEGLLPVGKVNISDWAPKGPREVLLAWGWYLIGRVQQAWGNKVGLVFYHGGINTENDQRHALCDLFLGIRGHGVTLADDFAGHLKVASAILHRGVSDPETFSAVPFDDGMGWLDELAEEMLEMEY